MSKDIYILGMDPARKNDSFGVTIHKVVTVKGKLVPKLVLLDQHHADSYVEISDMLDKGIFAKYKFTMMQIDYTNNQIFTDQLIERYTSTVVKKFIFTNQSKLNLMSNARLFMSEGYQFPIVPSSGELTLNQRNLLELKKQYAQQEVKITDSNVMRIDHPSGSHDDLLESWALSLYGVREYMLNKSSAQVVCGDLESNGAQFGNNVYQTYNTKDMWN